jgi:hypothetical protein
MKRFFLLSALLFLAPQIVKAQSSTVTFNVILKGQLEDSSFVPGRDYVRVTGNIPPLNRPLILKDTAPIDSIFSGEITFSSRFNNQQLRYNYELVIDRRVTAEDTPRTLPLNGQDVILPPLHFNAFAW